MSATTWFNKNTSHWPRSAPNLFRCPDCCDRKEIGHLALVDVRLDELGDNKILKNGTSQRMGLQLLGIFNTKEETQDACIVEINLGSLHQPLAYSHLTSPCYDNNTKKAIFFIDSVIVLLKYFIFCTILKFNFKCVQHYKKIFKSSFLRIVTGNQKKQFADSPPEGRHRHASAVKVSTVSCHHLGCELGFQAPFCSLKPWKPLCTFFQQRDAFGYNVLSADGFIRHDRIQNIQIVLVSLRTYRPHIEGGLDGTSRLMAVGTIGEMAVVKTGSHLGKEVRQFLRLEINHAELLDAWCVD